MGIKEFVKMAGIPSQEKYRQEIKIPRDTDYESILPGNAQNAKG